ncbi:PREDICTED: uncharacterized protein LOC104772968 [Camelina sativa]|uniref:Uncharacterized protein LOC104772968 n=1 Tax=Camelina sativa TaxID=90675 RepID=A0ABM0Y5F0_CAMSA|nr:PREDICTED: uncharacterized protein LOC104772968 [Camelina sativa]
MVTKDLNVEQGVMIISAQVSAIIQNKIPKKLPDPGSFVLDCTIFNERFARSLCDLGSSVNLKPRSVALILGMTNFQPTKITFILADRSFRIPDGILEDYEEEPKDPLILGRSFSATAGAIINVKKGQIGLNVGDLQMRFDMDKLVKRPTIDGQTFYVDTLSNLAEEIFKELHPEDPLDRALVTSAEEAEHLDDIAAGYVKLLDANEQVKKLVAQEELVGTSSQAEKLSDWNLEKAPKLDLKPLPAGLRIHLEEGAKTSIEHHRRLNPNLQDVVKKEIMKFLNAGIIYPISDSKWRCMMSIFTDMIEDYMEVFMDDFSVYRYSFKSCLDNLCKVLARCEERHLVLYWEKCHFMVRDGIVLGHRVSEAGFYRRFIKDFSKIARPLSALLCKDVKFEFTDECRLAFERIKQELVMGAMLGQRKDKKLHVIYYASRTLDDAQKNYATTEKELLAVVFAFEKFRSYLVGSKVIVHTDHAALKYLMQKKDAKPRLLR